MVNVRNLLKDKNIENAAMVFVTEYTQMWSAQVLTMFYEIDTINF